LDDNRIRLPATPIDFAADVGLTGQDHDNYPAPGQARFDWMRIFLQGLLAQQSSDSEPTQYREGTPWLDTSHSPPQLKIRVGTAWQPYAAVVALNQGQTNLLDWYAAVQPVLAAIVPDVTFSGTARGPVSQIIVPAPLRAVLGNTSRPFVYSNGLLLDPRQTVLESNVVLLGVNRLKSGDRFTVVIRGIPSQNFHIPDVPAP
jgi:hypothetical protein